MGKMDISELLYVRIEKKLQYKLSIIFEYINNMGLMLLLQLVECH